MGHIDRQKMVDATFAAMDRHLQLVEEYRYFQGITRYDVNITMGDSSFTMSFRPAGHFTLHEMRVRCVSVISRNIADIHDSTCSCIQDIRDSMHTLESIKQEYYLQLLDEEYH